MIRAVLAGLGVAVAALFVLLLLLVAVGVVSPPASAAGLHPDCNVTMPCIAPVSAKVARGRQLERAMPFGSPMYPPETAQSFLSGRPSGCPARAWCGCWLAKHLGLSDRSLWLARRWASLGSDAGGPRVGAIVVWRHHVGKITAVDGHRIRVLSGNDGRAVRDRWRTTAGVIAYRFAS